MLIEEEAIQHNRIPPGQEQDILGILEEGHLYYNKSGETEIRKDIMILLFKLTDYFKSRDRWFQRFFAPSSIYLSEDLRQLVEDELQDADQSIYLKLFFKAELQGDAEEVCAWTAPTLLKKFYFRLEDFARFSKRNPNVCTFNDEVRKIYSRQMQRLLVEQVKRHKDMKVTDAEEVLEGVKIYKTSKTYKELKGYAILVQLLALSTHFEENKDEIDL